MLSFVKPSPELTIIEPGCSVKLGDYYYSVIATPGHSDGHLCFFNEQYGVLFSGDHLIKNISSNIGLWPGGESNPLKEYLESLNLIRRLPCQTVLPAHSAPFETMKQRISELEVHHNERLELMKKSAAGGSTAFEICRQIFCWNLIYHELLFAMVETLAHLMYLVDKGELKVSQNNGINFYSNL